MMRDDGGGAASVAANGNSSTTFTVTNMGTQPGTMNFVVTACSGNLATGSCSVSRTGGTLTNFGDVMTTAVYFSAGPAAGSGTITLAVQEREQRNAARVGIGGRHGDLTGSGAD
jgi:hypothetical protein